MIHSASNLRYVLVRGPVQWEPLRILDSRALEWQGLSTTFYVLGASHAVSLQSDGTCLTELLSCVAIDIKAHILAEATTENPYELTTTVSGLLYRCRLTPVLLREDMKLQDYFGPQEQMEIAYPKQTGRLTPITAIGWRVTPQSLLVETIHTYPQEERGIRSESVFKKRP